jgi:hypothetical protein
MKSDIHLQHILKIADDSIILTKQILKFGAGNIIEDILKTHSQSLGRSDYANNMFFEAYSKDISKLEKITLRAAATKIAQGGNCHESASLVFANLMSNTTNLNIQMCRKQMIENRHDFHVFVRIVSDKHLSIIVDAWGSNRKAVLSSGDDEDEIIIMHEEVTNGTNVLFKKSENLIMQTDLYIYTQKKIKNCKGSINKLFETEDNLQHLEGDKYIGGRGTRAYHDPGL